MPRTSVQRSEIFVTTDWLAERLGAPDLVVVDASYYLSTMNRNAGAEYLAGHIPGAVRFDIDKIKDQSNSLPHMMPSAATFAEAVSKMGIGDGMTIIVYDGLGLFSAPRVRWMFKAFPNGRRKAAPLRTARKPRARAATLPRGLMQQQWRTLAIFAALCKAAMRKWWMPARLTAFAAIRQSHAPVCAPATCQARIISPLANFSPMAS
jgi:rhodanese-related sulfurtransferase